ncbi:MAG: hypothetical protein P8X81_03080 [Woeseiaceae bacterium]
MNIINNYRVARSSWLVTSACLLTLAPVAGALAAAGDDQPGSISLGVFVTDRDTKTRIDASTGETGSNVSLEGDLGLASSDSVFRIDGYFKFNDRHRIDVSWFDLSRSKQKQIDTEIIWNGTVYPINTVIRSNFDLAIYKAAYTWSFLRRDKGFLGASAGLYVADFKTTLSATDIGQRDGGDGTAPLPVFGLRGEYGFSEKWSLRASGELFALEYDNWTGTLVDIYAGIDYSLSEHVSLGVGYNAVTFNIGVSEQNFEGNVEWGYRGGLAFLKYDF